MKDCCTSPTDHLHAHSTTTSVRKMTLWARHALYQRGEVKEALAGYGVTTVCICFCKKCGN